MNYQKKIILLLFGFFIWQFSLILFVLYTPPIVCILYVLLFVGLYIFKIPRYIFKTIYSEYKNNGELKTGYIIDVQSYITRKLITVSVDGKSFKLSARISYPKVFSVIVPEYCEMNTYLLDLISKIEYNYSMEKDVLNIKGVPIQVLFYNNKILPALNKK